MMAWLIVALLFTITNLQAAALYFAWKAHRERVDDWVEEHTPPLLATPRGKTMWD